MLKIQDHIVNSLTPEQAKYYTLEEYVITILLKKMLSAKL